MDDVNQISQYMFGDTLNVSKFSIANFMSGDAKGDNLSAFAGLHKFSVLSS